MVQQSESKTKKAAYWRRVTGEWKRSGQSQAAFCASRDLKLTTFRWWRHRILRETSDAAKAEELDTKAPFIPIRLIDLPSPPSQAIEIHLPNARRIHVPPGFDPDTLRRVLAILDECAC